MNTKTLTKVRWSYKFECIDLMVKTNFAITSALRIIAENKSDVADKAAVEFHKMVSTTLVTRLVFYREILAICNGLTLSLQRGNISWKHVGQKFKSTRNDLNNLDVDYILSVVQKLCDGAGIPFGVEMEPLQYTRVGIVRYLAHCDTAYSPRDELLRLKKKSVDKIIYELDRRFSHENIDLLEALCSLDASSVEYLDYNAMKNLLDRYGDVLAINEILLRLECSRGKQAIENSTYIYSVYYPNLSKMMVLGKTMPVTTATVEESFSCMKRILSDLICLSVNYDIMSKNILDNIIDRWTTMNVSQSGKIVV